MEAYCSGLYVGVVDEKQKWSHTFRLCVGTVDTSLSPWRHSEIEISKNNFLDRKMKMVVYCSGHHVGTVDTLLSPVRFSEIKISMKIF